jgi:hypothetical protein
MKFVCGVCGVRIPKKTLPSRFFVCRGEGDNGCQNQTRIHTYHTDLGDEETFRCWECLGQTPPVIVTMREEQMRTTSQEGVATSSRSTPTSDVDDSGDSDSDIDPVNEGTAKGGLPVSALKRMTVQEDLERESAGLENSTAVCQSAASSSANPDGVESRQGNFSVSTEQQPSGMDMQAVREDTLADAVSDSGIQLPDSNVPRPCKRRTPAAGELSSQPPTANPSFDWDHGSLLSKQLVRPPNLFQYNPESTVQQAFHFHLVGGGEAEGNQRQRQLPQPPALTSTAVQLPPGPVTGPGSSASDGNGSGHEEAPPAASQTDTPPTTEAQSASTGVTMAQVTTRSPAGKVTQRMHEERLRNMDAHSLSNQPTTDRDAIYHDSRQHPSNEEEVQRRRRFEQLKIGMAFDQWMTQRQQDGDLPSPSEVQQRRAEITAAARADRPTAPPNTPADGTIYGLFSCAQVGSGVGICAPTAASTARPRVTVRATTEEDEVREDALYQEDDFSDPHCIGAMVDTSASRVGRQTAESGGNTSRAVAPATRYPDRYLDSARYSQDSSVFPQPVPFARRREDGRGQGGHAHVHKPVDDDLDQLEAEYHDAMSQHRLATSAQTKATAASTAREDRGLRGQQATADSIVNRTGADQVNTVEAVARELVSRTAAASFQPSDTAVFGQRGVESQQDWARGGRVNASQPTAAHQPDFDQRVDHQEDHVQHQEVDPQRLRGQGASLTARRRPPSATRSAPYQRQMGADDQQHDQGEGGRAEHGYPINSRTAELGQWMVA